MGNLTLADIFGILPSEVVAIAKLPHHVVEVKGGVIVFFCANGIKRHTIYPIKSNDEFWETVSHHPEVAEIEREWNISMKHIPYCEKCSRCQMVKEVENVTKKS
ncbi:MAG: hypothetical protein WC623_24135 [Pedobacter sp.]|uniref:hypothetical protein n=1 Tax=Pedobacter sp. TaxID=1411316 RepID=UPI003564F52E